MKIRQFLTFAATIVIGAFSVQAQAHNCGELSPLMTSLGKQYTELTYAPEASNANVKQSNDSLVDIINLIEQSKLHSGRGTRVECFGENGRWQEDAVTFALTDIDTRENNKGSLMLTAYEESNKYRKRKVIELPTTRKWQTPSKNEYSTSYLFRLQNFSNSGSRAAEIALNIQNGDKTVIVTEVLYINGLKVDWVTWELDN